MAADSILWDGRPALGGNAGPAAQTDVLQTPESKERREIRDARGGYKALLATADALLKNFTDWQRVDAGLLSKLQHDVYEYGMKTRGAMLFENLQLARYGTGYYRYHLVNVALLNVVIGRSLNTNAGWLGQLVTIGLLADIGMLLLPSYILDGSRELAEADRQAIRNHPADAAELLRACGVTDPVLLFAVQHHHERYGGGGYPDGLSGSAISMECRITAVSDSFDAALARRAYRQLKSPFDVLAEFAENEDGALDPELTGRTVKIISRMLVGRRVILSDHSVAVVDYVSAGNLAYPGVTVLGKRIQTDETLRPVSLTSFMPL